MKKHRVLGLGLAAPIYLFGALSAAYAQDVSQQEDIVVLGRGQPRQVQTVDGSELKIETPGASPIKALEQLPGVYFSGSDPFGTYEYASTLYLRGFNQTQLGFTLDGVPLGDMSYSNHNGLHISRAIINENVETEQLAQGASDLDAASTSNLGGTLRFMGRDPAEKFGGDAAISAGEDEFLRYFGRIDTGAIGPIDTRASLSIASSKTHLWKGDGKQISRQANLRILQPLGDSTLTFWLNGSERRENDYLEQSRNQLARRGYFANYLAPNYDLAVQLADIQRNIDATLPPDEQVIGDGVTNPAAGTDFPAGFESIDDAYYQGAGLRNDVIGALTWKGQITDALSFNVTGYSHTDKGQGPWFTPYVASPNAFDPTATTDNAPISFRGFSYGFTRWGALGSVAYVLGDHRLEAGGWYETNSSREGYNYYGLNRSGPNRSSTRFQNDPFYTDDFYSFETVTQKFYVQDTWKPIPNLTLQFGFKGQRVESEATKLIEDNVDVAPGDAGYTFGRIVVEDFFLPQAGFAYRLNARNEVFGSYGESVAAFPSQAGGVNANGGQAAIDDAVSTLKPERSRTFELGWRWRGERLEALAAAYYVQFDDRLAYFSASDSPILVSETIYRNVGSVRTLGLEATLRAKFTDSLSGMVSYTYNDSEYQDDVLTDAGILEIATKGKQVAGSPRDLIKAGLDYDNGSLFANLSYTYNGKWYYTYENDNPVKGYSLVDAALGYRFTQGWAKGTEVSVNVSNVFDERYISSYSALTERDPTGDEQVLLMGAPRAAFVTLRRSF